MAGLVILVIIDQFLINDGKKESEANADFDAVLHGKRELRVYSSEGYFTTIYLVNRR